MSQMTTFTGSCEGISAAQGNNFHHLMGKMSGEAERGKKCESLQETVRRMVVSYSSTDSLLLLSQMTGTAGHEGLSLIHFLFLTHIRWLLYPSVVTSGEKARPAA